ncbi:MAG: GNAT family N-acetyltransferase [Flavobacteriaceae bacterium]|nr:GNAT family N-acetyltransferase [Flavobacteriaceae bacterium]
MDFKLRPWHINDLDNLVKHANNPNIAKYLTDGFPYPYLKANGEKFIKYATADNPVHIFAIDINGEAVGGIGIHPQTDIQKKNAELGYWLAEPFWGKGIMTKAIKQITDFAFSTFEINRIFARPFGNNPGSQKILEKNGFVLEARFNKTLIKNGQFLDELIYAIRKK